MPRMMASYLSRSTGLFAALVCGGALIHFVILEPTEVDGRSMSENFHDGDLVLIDKISLLIRQPRRGDVISFFNRSPETLAIKRVVGLPGEIVIIEKGKVSVIQTDGTELELIESYLENNAITLPESGYQFTYPILGPDEYFLLGDNREHSDDSRIIGPVKRSQIIGIIH